MGDFQLREQSFLARATISTRAPSCTSEPSIIPTHLRDMCKVLMNPQAVRWWLDSNISLYASLSDCSCKILYSFVYMTTLLLHGHSLLYTNSPFIVFNYLITMRSILLLILGAASLVWRIAGELVASCQQKTS